MVKLQWRGPTAIVRMENPPLNVMSAEVRQQLLSAIQEVERSERAAGVVICAQGRAFSTGMDLEELRSGLSMPGCHEVFAAIENLRCPVLAVAQGPAIGAGVELMLACHYRCASRNAAMSLPELALGVIPGAGGTQRLPRLIGARAALDLLLKARPVSAARAKALGLIDHLVDGDPIEAALDCLAGLIAGGAGARPTSHMDVDTGGFSDAFVSDVLREAGDNPTRAGLVKLLMEAVSAACTRPFVEGIEAELRLSQASLAYYRRFI
jgi:3-hydroxyacyl-CoA dehydrogenase